MGGVSPAQSRGWAFQVRRDMSARAQGFLGPGREEVLPARWEVTWRLAGVRHRPGLSVGGIGLESLGRWEPVKIFG